jgi:hypothetical protein
MGRTGSQRFDDGGTMQSTTFALECQAWTALTGKEAGQD